MRIPRVAAYERQLAEAIQFRQPPTIAKRTVEWGIFSVIARTVGQVSIVVLCSAWVSQTSIAAYNRPTNAPVYDFDIPQQDLNGALKAVALTSKYQLFYRSEIVQGIVSPRLRARSSVQQAMDVLLAGSDLTYEITPAAVVLIRKKGLRMKIRKFILGSEVSAVGPGGAEISLAQEIQEIIVTAQKREETAQEIPVSIDVITGEKFSREGVRDVKDIGKMSTDLEIDSSAGQATRVGVRGIQQNGFAPTGETLATIHLDGMFIGGFYGFNAIMHDLERVEVLSGPQGTLYGRNSVAGAINFITRLPGKELEGNASVEIGSKNTRRLTGGISVPISDAFAVRLAANKFTRDAFLTDGTGEQDWWASRLNAVWTLNDANKVIVRVEYADFGGTNDGTTLLGINAGARLTSGSVPASVTNYLNSPTLQDPYNNGPYNTQRALKVSAEDEMTNKGVSLEYSHDFGGFSSVLLAGHREISGVNRGPTLSVSSLIPNTVPTVQDADTAEFRLVSNNSERFEWVAGLFYYQADTLASFGQPVRDNSPDPSSGLNIPWCPCIGGAYYPNNGESESYAIFGQGTWTPSFNDKLHITGGLRWSQDVKLGVIGFLVGDGVNNTPILAFNAPGMVAAVQPLFAGAVDIANGDPERKWDKVQWKLGVNYDVGDSALFYGTISTGYKSGAIAFGPTPVVEPEDLLAYEIGFKSQMLDKTLQVNSSVWWYDYKNLEANVNRVLPVQVLLPTGNFLTTAQSPTNVGEANLAGISTDIDWLATDNDRFGLSFTYVYSKITDGAEKGNPANILFNEGERVGDAPEWQVLSRYSRTFNFQNGATLNPQLKYQWQSEKLDLGLYRAEAFYPNHRNTPFDVIPSRGVLDFSVRYMPAGDRWGITAYGNNLTDELVIRTQTYNANPADATYGHITGGLGEPRTYGVILDMKF